MQPGGAPHVVAFAARYPRLRVELDLRDDLVNVIADGYDLVIRMGAVQDSELIGRRLAEIELIRVASPDYLKRAGRPATPAELAKHEFIALSSGFVRWHVENLDIPITPRFSAHSLSAARLAALS